MTAVNTVGVAGDPRLYDVRGSQKPARLNARTAAALSSNPGCDRRTVTDLAQVNKERLSSAAGIDAPFGQSPFAITRGNAFENRLKRGTNYDMLFTILTEAIGLPPDRYSVQDLGSDEPAGPAAIRARAYRTRQTLRWILSGDPDAPAVLDHPVLTLTIAGVEVFVEPDALALAAVGGRLIPAEIKSFASVDRIIDGAKAAAAAKQVAVYVYALRQAAVALGHKPEVVSTEAVLITPVNTTTQQAVGNPLPVGPRVAVLERQLDRVTKIGDILDRLPPGFTLDPSDPVLAGLTDEQKAEELAARLRLIPANYQPGCRSECGFGEFCHRQAVESGNPMLLGPSTRDALAGVTDLRQAVRIAHGRPQPADAALPETEVALRRAARIQREAEAAARRRNGAA
ncbi:hypothetical protein [Micromonospora parva]|uniref:hypothetical protein n=1 Tax=Micromonospora parva TaxID=1464048 RepID=UPI0033C6889A